MLIQILLFLFGLLLLVKGADWLVEGASALAKKYNVSDLVIGLTVVAFGTSTPELIVNIYASFQDHQDIVFANVIGSNNVNLFIILGISGLVIPMNLQSSTVWREIPLSLIAAIILYILCNDIFLEKHRLLTRIDGIILFCFFCFFLFYVYRQLKNDYSLITAEHRSFSVVKIWGFIIIGLISLIVGGKLVVTGALEIARSLGISEKIIGLTIVALGTSLPELATSVVAAFKKNIATAVGNIIGSNIFNISLVLAVSAWVRPVSYDTVYNTDLYFFIAGTVFLFMAMFTGQKGKLDRWEAGLMLIAYAGYSIYLVQKEIL